MPVSRKVCALACLLAIAVADCGPYRGGDGDFGERAAGAREKVEVEAYLFDAKIRRHGKPTSFRLEIFQTDSVIALGGRGYLGKGALKGRLTSDTLHVYFPATNEYVYEAVSELMSSFDCVGEVPHIDLMSLFSRPPDSVLDNDEFSVMADYGNSNRPEFRIGFRRCSWEINLVYDRRDDRWRVRKFSFTDGDETTLKATRREYKRWVRVNVSKFAVTVGAGAVRITP